MNRNLWAGRSLIAMGVVHLVGMGAQTTQYVDDWFTGSLWGLSRAEFTSPSGAGGAFWLVVASFAVPLLLLGVLVVHLAKRGAAVPESIGWGLAAWCVFGSVILEPAPLALGLFPAVLIVLAARAARRTDDEAAAVARTAAAMESIEPAPAREHQHAG